MHGVHAQFKYIYKNYIINFTHILNISASSKLNVHPRRPVELISSKLFSPWRSNN